MVEGKYRCWPGELCKDCVRADEIADEECGCAKIKCEMLNMLTLIPFPDCDVPAPECESEFPDEIGVAIVQGIAFGIASP